MIPLPVDAGDISYSDRGSGEAVVLVHAGVFSDWFLPLSDSRTLDSLRVIRIRRAGYAGSEPSRHLTIADHAEHLATLANHLGLGRVHWVGHSSGCQIVLQLALDHPHLVKTLVLIEPAAGGGFAVPAAEELGRQFLRMNRSKALSRSPAVNAPIAGPMSQQITALATTLLPQATVMRVAGTNHMMPLQAPDLVGRLLHDFVRQHS